MKRILAMLLCVALLTTFVGCGQSSESKEEGNAAAAAETETPSKKSDEKVTVGLIIGVPEIEFFNKVETGVKDACERNGWDCLVGYGTGDKVLEHGRTFISQEVDVIVNFGVTTGTGDTLVTEAAAANIPVIDVDVACGGYFFGANNEQAGAVLGDALSAYIKENVPDYENKTMKAVMFWGGREGDDVRLRLTGAIKGLNENGITAISEENNYINDTIVWQNVDDDTKVKEYAKNQLAALEDSTDIIIFVGVASSYGPSYVSAIAETGLDKSRVLCVTHNEDEVFANNLKDENTPWIASTAYLPDKYGEYIEGMIKKLVNGEELGEKTLLEHVAITRDNVNEFFPGTIN